MTATPYVPARVHSCVSVEPRVWWAAPVQRWLQDRWESIEAELLSVFATNNPIFIRNVGPRWRLRPFVVWF